MTRHSDRARRNSRLGIDLRISVIKTRLEELKKEKRTYIKYRLLGLNRTFCTRVINVITAKIARRQIALNRYLARRTRWKNEGKI